MRNRWQFNIRTLLISIALVAFLFAIVPPLVWRWKVNSAIEELVTAGPERYQTFTPLLLSDHHRVLNCLLDISQSGDSHLRRVNALKAIRAVAYRKDSLDGRQRLLPKLITLACKTETVPSVSTAAAEIIGDWIAATGATQEERTRIVRRAEFATGHERIAWVKVLDGICGRQEVELLLRFGDSHEDALRLAVCNSQFKQNTWPGMLPQVGQWIYDPVIADSSLEFSVLSQTPDGRELLLKYLCDDLQPLASRMKALDGLKQSVAGVKLLKTACSNDDKMASQFSRLLKKDCQQAFEIELQKLLNRNGEELWEELVGGLDPTYWFPRSSGAWVPAEREQNVKWSLECIHLLSENTNLTTQDECRRWLQSTPPIVVEQSSLLRMVVAHPELAHQSAIRRRLVPVHLGYIPEECVSLYHQLIVTNEMPYRELACEALLNYTDSPEAIEVAIDLIDQSSPNEHASVSPKAIHTLTRRFAVNYFWDIDAWRKWASERRPEAK